MTKEQAKALRAPFPAAAIGKLPKPTKKENPKGKCDVCGGYHGLPAVHLDYVGHAATTDRLLQVDADWSWEPMAYGPAGEPMFTNGGMWIWLTVAGVKRPGFGDGASPKEIIGDAIRNAAMRFGVALDLWAKEDLHAEDGAEPTANGEPQARQENPVAADISGTAADFVPPAGAATAGITDKQNKAIGAITTALVKAEKMTTDDLRFHMSGAHGKTSRKELTSKEASEVIDWLKAKEAEAVPAAAGAAADEPDIPFEPTA